MIIKEENSIENRIFVVVGLCYCHFSFFFLNFALVFVFKPKMNSLLFLFLLSLTGYYFLDLGEKKKGKKILFSI